MIEPVYPRSRSCIVLVRVSYVSEMIGTAGRTALSLAQIVGVSAINNRRDHLCSALLFHDGRVVQVIEGHRMDVDRLLQRLAEDTRLGPLKIVGDKVISSRKLTEAVIVCHDPQRTLDQVGLSDLEEVTSRSVEAMMEFRIAA